VATARWRTTTRRGYSNWLGDKCVVGYYSWYIKHKINEYIYYKVSASRGHNYTAKCVTGSKGRLVIKHRRKRNVTRLA
jgi:hypothetical protein